MDGAPLDPATSAVLRRVFGVSGILLSGMLFLSPVPTVREVVRVRSVLKFSQLPYLAQIVESSVWIMWSLAMGDRLEMLVCNIVGITIMFPYVVIFATFTPPSMRRKRLLQALGGALVLLAALLLAVNVFNLTPSQAELQNLLGTYAVCLNILKYASPLATAHVVIRTKSNKFMPLPLTAMIIVNSLLWGMYALLLQDMFILIPNSFGVVGGVAQAFLWFWYRRTPASHGNLKESEGADPAKPVTPEGATAIDVEKQDPAATNVDGVSSAL